MLWLLFSSIAAGFRNVIHNFGLALKGYQPDENKWRHETGRQSKAKGSNTHLFVVTVVYGNYHKA